MAVYIISTIGLIIKHNHFFSFILILSSSLSILGFVLVSIVITLVCCIFGTSSFCVCFGDVFGEPDLRDLPVCFLLINSGVSAGDSILILGVGACRIFIIGGSLLPCHEIIS